MLVSMWAISVVAFVVIELPSGDFVDFLVLQIEAETGVQMEEEEVVSLRAQYGLDRTPIWRYLKWVGDLLRGDLGRSFAYNKPVAELLAERVPLTILISLASLVVTFGIAIPIGIYSATHQYSIGDNIFSGVGFLGLATPNFALALVLMWIGFRYFDISIGGLYSTEYRLAPWSWGKFWELIKHLPVPLIVIGTAGTAGLIRIMRAVLLDELGKQYVITARAKGVGETRLLFRYPVRIAINPMISTVGWLLPAIVSGEAITAIVLNLPTTGPMLLRALLAQDTLLAGSTVLFLGFLTVVGTFVSDLALLWVDPRIRFGRAEA
jgi:peptide/nickel transport system permease protein